jgi:hypothetical protein
LNCKMKTNEDNFLNYINNDFSNKCINYQKNKKLNP